VDAGYAVPLCHKALAFVVLQREPELFDGAVALRERIKTMQTEVTTRMQKVKVRV
jgi:hypothetical protein